MNLAAVIRDKPRTNIDPMDMSRTLPRLLLAATIALAVLPARAEGLLKEPAEQRVHEALETPYAQALLRTFVATVRRKGDAACLREKAFDDATLAARGRALLQRYGVQMFKIMDDNLDRTAYEKALDANAGRGAVAELERLKRDGDVKKLNALYRPAELAKVVDVVAENYDRYLLIGRINLDPISPIARGEPEPKENPTQAVDAAVQRFIEQHRSKKLDRYLDLVDATESARTKGFSIPVALKLGPMTYFDGADRDLAELCIGRR